MFVVATALANLPSVLNHSAMQLTFRQHVIYHRSDIVNSGIGDDLKIPVLGIYFYFCDVRTTREGARDGEASHSVERMRLTLE